jgi:hypothetical protein
MDDTDAVAQLVVEDGRVVWRLRGKLPVAARVTLDGQLITLRAERDTGGGIVVTVVAEEAFDLEVETEFTTFVEQVPAGRTRYLLTYLDRTDVRQV